MYHKSANVEWGTQEIGKPRQPHEVVVVWPVKHSLAVWPDIASDDDSHK
jgi:hypothetical protein